jgi:hypothetical protein
MATNLRYQVYSLTKDGELEKPLTEPLLTRDRANKYFSDCAQCALVSINEYGSIVEILEKNTTPLKIINKKPKIKKRKRR